MNNVNKTLYIPLYGKALVSRKNIILHDPTAEAIWEKAGFALKGKSRSKWLAYYMAMRAAVYDQWTTQAMADHPGAIVLHIGCGLDSRAQRVAAAAHWYDIDFPDVIAERRKYYTETDRYHMVAADMRTAAWQRQIDGNRDALVVMEGVSMYFQPEELTALLSGISRHFNAVHLLMDCYTERAAKASRYKNPINDVGVTRVYGYDHPQALAESTGFRFAQEHSMTPQRYINELQGMEKAIFQRLYAGSIASALYRMYEFHKD